MLLKGAVNTLVSANVRINRKTGDTGGGGEGDF